MTKHIKAKSINVSLTLPIGFMSFFFHKHDIKPINYKNFPNIFTTRALSNRTTKREAQHITIRPT